MATCFFCKRGEGPFVLSSKTASVCRTCAQILGAELGLSPPLPAATDSREQWDRRLVVARLRALGREPRGTCSYCGTVVATVAVRRRASEVASERVIRPEPSPFICRSCVERAAAATKPS